MSRPVYIYGLEDPRTGEIRYVGRTVALKFRMDQHTTRPSSIALREWVGELAAEELRPRYRVLETCDDKSWRAAERRWVAHYREQGVALLNVCEGGRSAGRPHNRALKLSTSVRLTGDAKTLLWGLSLKIGMGPSNVIEQLIREKATREKVTLEWVRAQEDEG